MSEFAIFTLLINLLPLFSLTAGSFFYSPSNLQNTQPEEIKSQEILQQQGPADFFGSYTGTLPEKDIGETEVPINSNIKRHGLATTPTPQSSLIRNLELNAGTRKIILPINQTGIAFLIEYDNAGAIKSIWHNVEYEQKGNSRRMCRPPVLNLKFDKKQGKKKLPLFNGSTSYQGLSNLNYQKIRLIPDCDYWGDFGKNHVLLREYFTYSLLRNFGVPTVEPIAFASIKFVSGDTDSGQDGFDHSKSYDYLILQRNNEKDDQVPFLWQMGLSSIKEANKVPQGATFIGDRLRWAGYQLGDTKDVLELESNSSLLYLLFSDFLNIEDHYIYSNEDYGYDSALNKWKIVPFDFDSSLTECSFKSPSLVKEIISKNSIKQNEYKTKYYSLAREIFGNPNNLSKMLAIIDKFPFEADKESLKNYITARFYQFAIHFNTEDFANENNQKYILATNNNMELAEDMLKSDGLDKDFCSGGKYSLKPYFTKFISETKNKIDSKSTSKTDTEILKFSAPAEGTITTRSGSISTGENIDMPSSAGEVTRSARQTQGAGQSDLVIPPQKTSSITFKSSTAYQPQIITTETLASIGRFTIIQEGNPISIKNLRFKVNISNSNSLLSKALGFFRRNIGTFDDISDIGIYDSNEILTAKGEKDSNAVIVFNEPFTITATGDYTIRAVLNSRFKTGQTIFLSANFYKNDAIFIETDTGKTIAPPKGTLILNKVTIEEGAIQPNTSKTGDKISRMSLQTTENSNNSNGTASQTNDPGQRYPVKDSTIKAEEDWDRKNISYARLSEGAAVSNWQQCKLNAFLKRYPQYPKIINRTTTAANLLVKRKNLIEKTDSIQGSISLLNEFIELTEKTLKIAENTKANESFSSRGAILLPFPTSATVLHEGAKLESRCLYQEKDSKIDEKLLSGQIARIGELNPSFATSKTLSLCNPDATKKIEEAYNDFTSFLNAGKIKQAIKIPILLAKLLAGGYNGFLLIDGSLFSKEHPWIKSPLPCSFGLGVEEYMGLSEKENRKHARKGEIAVRLTVQKPVYKNSNLEGIDESQIALIVNWEDTLSRTKKYIKEQLEALTAMKPPLENELNNLKNEITKLDRQIDEALASPDDTPKTDSRS